MRCLRGSVRHGFLSTPSARRATRWPSGAGALLKFLSTPSARRATRCTAATLRNRYISIHALREEGDRAADMEYNYSAIFLSTPSARRATMSIPSRLSLPSNFYPRPPRGGRHARLHRPDQIVNNFYPRPPRGGRRKRFGIPVTICEFLSTPSARRATTRRISGLYGATYFYPRPPRGGRRSAEADFAGVKHISIHALREEGDFACPRIRSPR